MYKEYVKSNGNLSSTITNEQKNRIETIIKHEWDEYIRKYNFENQFLFKIFSN